MRKAACWKLSWKRSHSATIINEEIFLQDFQAALKDSLQNYSKILKKYVLGTTYIVKSLAFSVFRQHNSVLPVAKDIHK